MSAHNLVLNKIIFFSAESDFGRNSAATACVRVFSCFRVFVFVCFRVFVFSCSCVFVFLCFP